MSSSARRVKPYSAHAHRKPLSVSVNHVVHSKRSGLKQEPLSKRPRSSSHSISHVVKESHDGGGTKTLADREQHPDAAAFLALVRNVSEQLDENSRKKQRIAIETVKEREKIRTKYGQGNDQRTPILPRSGIVPKQDKGKGREDPRVIESESPSTTSNNFLFNGSIYAPNLLSPFYNHQIQLKRLLIRGTTSTLYRATLPTVPCRIRLAASREYLAWTRTPPARLLSPILAT